MPSRKARKEQPPKRRTVKRISNDPLKLPAVRRKRRIAAESLPATFLKDGGKIASVIQYVDDTVPTLALDELSESQWLKLAVSRIEAEPDFEVMIPGRGVFDVRKAKKELNDKSDVGRTLLLLHKLQVRQQVDTARKTAISGPTGKRRKASKRRR